MCSQSPTLPPRGLDSLLCCGLGQSHLDAQASDTSPTPRSVAGVVCPGQAWPTALTVGTGGGSPCPLADSMPRLPRSDNYIFNRRKPMYALWAFSPGWR